MPHAQVPGSDTGSDNRLGQGTDLIPSFPAILPEVRGPKADTRLCPSAVLQRGNSTDMPWLTHTTCPPSPPSRWQRVGVPRYETAHSPYPVAIRTCPVGDLAGTARLGNPGWLQGWLLLRPREVLPAPRGSGSSRAAHFLLLSI